MAPGVVDVYDLLSSPTPTMTTQPQPQHNTYQSSSPLRPTSLAAVLDNSKEALSPPPHINNSATLPHVHYRHSPPSRPISIPVHILTDEGSAPSAASPLPLPPKPPSTSQHRRGTSDSPVSVRSSSPAPPASPLALTSSPPPPTSAASSASSAAPPQNVKVENDIISNQLGTTTTTTPDAPPSAKPRSSRPTNKISATTGTHHSPRSSPSPPPSLPQPPIQTVRLEIKLGGPENYEVDVAAMAKETGQRPTTPTMVVKPEEVSSGESDTEGKKKKKKKKKNVASEYYDISDPFIDDSELAIDERTWIAQTKQQGFYVSSGEVALLKDKPKKPKSKKPASTAAGTSTSAKLSSSKAKQDPGGNRDQPVAVGDDGGGGTSLDDGGGSSGPSRIKSDDDEVGQKRKRYITVVDQAGKRRKIVDIEIQDEIESLKAAIANENWTQKGKFPPTVKPVLARLAMSAIRLGEYDDHFFSLMPTLFPYNKFTMTKLIKRTVFQDHVKYLIEKQDALLKELAEQAKAGFSKAEEEWEKSVQAWDKRQEKARLEAAAAGGGDAEAGERVNASTAPTRHSTEEMEVDGDAKDRDKDKDKEKEDGAPQSTAPTTAAGKDPHPPSKRYRLTEPMKAIVWRLVTLSNECCRLENEKNALENSVIQVSEQGSRKVLYQKIVAAFPEGWMSSGQISRDVSSMKKKLEKEAMENDAV